jgi:hypothetical protein
VICVAIASVKGKEREGKKEEKEHVKGLKKHSH